MYIQYYYNFSVGKNTHLINLYETYTEEEGLADLKNTFEETQMNKILLKIVDFPKNQTIELVILMRSRDSGIISPTGEYFKY